LRREGDLIPWVVQGDGEDSCGLGIFLGVISDYEPKKWVMRRELEIAIGRVCICGFISSFSGWPLMQIKLV
jgi:hypothetical protein